MKRLVTVALFLCVLVVGVFAQTASKSLPVVPQEVLGQATAHRVRAHQAAATGDAASASAFYETQVTPDSPITIQPGQFFVLPQSQLNFTGADHAAIALTSLGQDLTGLRIVPMWAAPGTWFNATDLSGAFPVLDHGGIYTPVYGPALKVMLYNGNTTPLTIKQLSVYVAKPGN